MRCLIDTEEVSFILAILDSNTKKKKKISHMHYRSSQDPRQSELSLILQGCFKCSAQEQLDIWNLQFSRSLKSFKDTCLLYVVQYNC